MKILTDKLILTLYCLLTALFVSFDRSFVAGYLLSISLAFSCHFFDSKRYSLILSLAFSIIFFFFPVFYLFLPLVLYEVFKHRLWIPFGIYGIGFGINFMQESVSLLLFLLLGCFICLILEEHTTSYNNLYFLYRKTRDDSQERNLLLKKNNQSLLEKQDYEIYTATLKERNRIAREIHDNVGHMISRSILMAGAVRTLNKDKILEQPLASLDDTLATAMNSIRESVHDLHDESVNLKEVITGLVHDFNFCDVSLDYDMSFEIPRELKYSFISITKEALSNIMKHSDATKVQIRMREHPGLYQLILADNGTTPTNHNSSGIGLTNMEERVNALRGNIVFHTDEGFRIFITVPKNVSLRPDTDIQTNM